MAKQQSKSFSKISLLVVALVLALCSALSLSNFAVFAEEKEGISWAKPITLSYQKDQKITIDGKEYANIPSTIGGKLTFKYLNNGSYETREVDIEQATINGIKNDTSKDRITYDGFSTSDNIDTSKDYVVKTMTLKFIPKEDTSKSFTLEVEYRVYTSADSMAGMEQLTKILSTINNVLDNILAPLLIVMASIGMIFAIFLGMKLAKANNAEEREEAKKRVIYTVIGIAVCVALIIVFKLFARFSIEWLGDANFFELPISK